MKRTILTLVLAAMIMLSACTQATPSPSGTAEATPTPMPTPVPEDRLYLTDEVIDVVGKDVYARILDESVFLQTGEVVARDELVYRKDGTRLYWLRPYSADLSDRERQRIAFRNRCQSMGVEAWGQLAGENGLGGAMFAFLTESQLKLVEGDVDNCLLTTYISSFWYDPNTDCWRLKTESTFG